MSTSTQTGASDKPHPDGLPPWIPPAESVHVSELEWAQLYTLDLGQVSGDEYDHVPPQVVRDVGRALSEDGFMYAENHGLSEAHVLRMFALAQYAFAQIPLEQKLRFKSDPLNTGSFAGYKQEGHWKVDGVKDRVEQWNFLTEACTPEQAPKTYPAELLRYFDEIRAFAQYNHDVILRKILNILSLVLKVPVDTLWKLSAGDDNFRFAVCHRPPAEEERAASGVRIQGHTDFGSLTILWSQPIASLQVLGSDNQWRHVRHRPNGLVINIGDLLHFLSGGFFKSTIHRVIAPPEDQLPYERVGLFYFAKFNQDLRLTPLDASPLTKGAQFWQQRIAAGQLPPTTREWYALRVSSYGQERGQRSQDGHDHETIAGEKVTLYNNPRPIQV